MLNLTMLPFYFKVSCQIFMIILSSLAIIPTGFFIRENIYYQNSLRMGGSPNLAGIFFDFQTELAECVF